MQQMVMKDLNQTVSGNTSFQTWGEGVVDVTHQQNN